MSHRLQSEVGSIANGAEGKSHGLSLTSRLRCSYRMGNSKDGNGVGNGRTATRLIPGRAEVSYGNDALLSPEVIAFQQVDARLGYSSATIEYDRNSCAIYRAIAPDGQVYTELFAPRRQFDHLPSLTSICVIERGRQLD